MRDLLASTQQALTAPVRQFKGKVEHYRGSTLLHTFTQADYLQEFEVQRVAEEGKFFGMVVSQRFHMKLRDLNRSLDIQSGDYLVAHIAVASATNYVRYPYFKITEINRKEKTNQLLITAWDVIDELKNHTVDEVNFTKPYTIRGLINQIADYIQANFNPVGQNTVAFARKGMEYADYSLALQYTKGANFEGTENLKEVLQYIAEVTQAVIYMSSVDKLTVKRLANNDASADLTITKDLQIDLTTKTNRKLVGIAHITSLGDNVEANLGISGTTQQVIDNPFWDLREDIDTIVNSALTAIGGLVINQFSCSWRGNYGLEIGDKIGIITKDNQTVYSYVLDDVITYDGTFTEKTQWEYSADESVDTNPSSIGDKLKQTYARVDKQEKTIELMASDVSANKENISQLFLDTQSITASVSSYQQNITSALGDINGELQSIRNEVSAQMTDEQILLSISQAIEGGVTSVRTETGFTFDKDGLTISKSDSEMTTLIDEDGMTINKGGSTVLDVNNVGVDATNLTAHGYLRVGDYSRFEDYGSRTGCFWIGS